jgi:hypothetical protein
MYPNVITNMKFRLLCPKRYLLVTLLLASVSLYAQNTLRDPLDEGGKRISGGYGYATIGISTQDLSSLNAYAGNGVNFQEKPISMGGGGQLMIKNLVLGGEGGRAMGQEARLGSQDLLYSSGWGKFYLGYVLYSKNGLLLYPKFGLGRYKQSLLLKEYGGFGSVDTVFTGTYPSTIIVKTGVLMSLGFAFEWMPGFDETAGSGAVVGFEAGYHLGISENAWEAHGVKLNGGPSLLPSGIYAALHIGFGGWNLQ